MSSKESFWVLPLRPSSRGIHGPFGTLGEAREAADKLIVAGKGVQKDIFNRWGDYSSMAIDPSDDCTFWYAQEYYKTTGAFNWVTRLASFKFKGCT